MLERVILTDWGVINDNFGHAVANVSSVFAVSQPRSMIMQPGFKEQFESYYTGCDTQDLEKRLAHYACVRVCACVCVCVCVTCACVDVCA